MNLERAMPPKRTRYHTYQSPKSYELYSPIANHAQDYRRPGPNFQSNEQESGNNSSRRQMRIENLLNPVEEDTGSSAASSYNSSLENSQITGHGWGQPARFLTSLKLSSSERHDPPRRPSVASSLSSDDSTTNKESRGFRPPYTLEQQHFLWFFIIDLNRSWDETLRQFGRTFPSEVRNKGGLQCKFYRVLSDEGLQKRDLNKKERQADVKRMTGDPDRYGFWLRKRIRYPWMHDYASRLPGKLSVQSVRADLTNDAKQGF